MNDNKASAPFAASILRRVKWRPTTSSPGAREDAQWRRTAKCYAGSATVRKAENEIKKLPEKEGREKSISFHQKEYIFRARRYTLFDELECRVQGDIIFP